MALLESVSCLADVYGVTPPITRDYVTRGAFHGYKPFFVETECPGIPKGLYVKALRAEGVAVEMPGSTPLHRSALYRDMGTGLFHYGTHGQERCDDRRLFGGTGSDESFPNCDSFLSQVLDHTTFTYEPFALVDQYVEAFAKVYNHRNELRRFADIQKPGPCV